MDFPLIQHWVNDANALIATHLPRYAPLWRSNVMQPEHGKLIVALSSACYTCSSGQLILLEHGRIAEAEVLGRTTIEGTLKFIYLLEERSTFVERFGEYANTFDFASIKDHFAITGIAQSQSIELEPMLHDLLFADEELEAKTSAHTKSERKSIQERWSVQAIVRHLCARSNKERGNYLRLLRAYAIAGHLAHMDAYGIIAMRERDARSRERAKALNEAQAATVIANVVTFSMLRLGTALAFAGEPSSDILAVYREAQTALDPLELVIYEWMKSEYPRDTDQ